MKTISRLAALALTAGALLPALVTTTQAAPQTAGVQWQTDFKAAQAQAKRLKKPMFLDFSTEWCSGCQVLAKTTFRDPKFIAASREWVMVMVNPEKSPANAQLEKRYKVMGYPTLLLTDASGKVIDTVEGARPARLLVPKMSAAKTQLKTQRVAFTR